MNDGVIFPPVDVYDISGVLSLVDGYHRIAAVIRNGGDEIEANVVPCRDFSLPPYEKRGPPGWGRAFTGTKNTGKGRSCIEIGRDELIGQEVTFKFRYEDGTETGNVTKTIRAQR